MVTVTIDGQTVEVEANATLLDAAMAAGIKIPTLCYHPDQKVKANCRICVVEVEARFGPGLFYTGKRRHGGKNYLQTGSQGKKKYFGIDFCSPFKGLFAM